MQFFILFDDGENFDGAVGYQIRLRRRINVFNDVGHRYITFRTAVNTNRSFRYQSISQSINEFNSGTVVHTKQNIHIRTYNKKITIFITLSWNQLLVSFCYKQSFHFQLISHVIVHISFIITPAITLSLFYSKLKHNYLFRVSFPL